MEYLPCVLATLPAFNFEKVEVKKKRASREELKEGCAVSNVSRLIKVLALNSQAVTCQATGSRQCHGNGIVGG